MTTKRLDRRTFLRASGIAMGLPLMESMLPGSLRAEATNQPDVRRMLAICAPLGMHTPLLFPDKTGTDYEATPYLEPLQSLRNKFTIMSGLMHPDVDGGHSAEKSFLTGAAHPGQPSFKNTISVDQYAAERMGHLTRVPSLTLSANHTGLSYTRSGVQIPSETRPSKLFGKLFLEGNAEEKAAQMRRIEDGQSIMDLVRDQTRGVSRKLGREDNETLDQYLTSVRELEERLVMQEKWAKLPKPKVDQKAPDDIEDRGDFVGRMALMYDLIFLAFRTDSTRLVTFCGAGGNYVPTLAGVDEDWHNLSHHGKEGGLSLLDQTAIFSGSNLGNASSHNNTNLPVIAAGGRFKHGQHLSFDPEKAPPLCNLFVSYFQHLGIEVDRFSSGTGTLSGI